MSLILIKKLDSDQLIIDELFKLSENDNVRDLSNCSSTYNL